MRRLLLLMFAAAISFAADAQSTNRQSSTEQSNKSQTGQAASKSGTIRKASADLTAVEYAKMHYVSSNDWYHTLTTSDGSTFRFIILTEAMESGRTYTSADGEIYVGSNSATIYNEGSKEDFDATAMDFTWTKGDNGKVDVVAHMTLVNGDQYTVTYAKAANPTPVGTVTKTFTDANLNITYTDFSESQGVFVFSGSGGGITASIVYCSQQIAGTYDYHEIGESSMVMTAGDTEVHFIDGDINVSADEGSYTCHAVMMGDDKIVYDLTFVLPAKPAEGIGTVGTPAAKGVRYNLAGQKVGHGYKGIVISGGKKMLVR